MAGCIGGWMDGPMGGWMGGWVDMRADGWMDGWVGEWMDLKPLRRPAEDLLLLAKPLST